MPSHKLPPEILEKALELQSKLHTQNEIAKILGIHFTTLSRVLSRHNRRRDAYLAKRHAATRARQAYQLEQMASDAYRGWERSQLDAVSVKEVEGDAPADGKGGGNRTETTTKGQAGDVSFLSEARAQLAEIRKVLRMDIGKDDKGPDEDVLKAMATLRAYKEKVEGKQG